MNFHSLHSRIDVKEHNAVANMREGQDRAEKKRVSSQA